MMSLFEQIHEDIARLREQCQRCESRLRRSVAAMEALQERLLMAVRDCPIHEATELLDASEHIRVLLSGEEGQP